MMLFFPGAGNLIVLLLIFPILSTFSQLIPVVSPRSCTSHSSAAGPDLGTQVIALRLIWADETDTPSYLISKAKVNWMLVQFTEL